MQSIFSSQKIWQADCNIEVFYVNYFGLNFTIYAEPSKHLYSNVISDHGENEKKLYVNNEILYYEI